MRSVELGMVHNVRIFVRSSFDKPEDIDPRKPPPGTLICDEGDIVEQQVVTGIAFSKDEAQISIRRVQDKPGVAAAIFGPLADGQHQRRHDRAERLGRTAPPTDLTFTVPSADYRARRVDVLDKAKSAIGYRAAGRRDRRRQGLGHRHRHAQPRRASPHRRSRRLPTQKINILAITTSEIKFSVLIDAAQTDLAVRTLHTLYGLDKA